MKNLEARVTAFSVDAKITQHFGLSDLSVYNTINYSVCVWERERKRERESCSGRRDQRAKAWGGEEAGQCCGTIRNLVLLGCEGPGHVCSQVCGVAGTSLAHWGSGLHAVGPGEPWKSIYGWE